MRDYIGMQLILSLYKFNRFRNIAGFISRATFAVYSTHIPAKVGVFRLQ